MKILFVSAAVIIADQLSKFYIKGISIPFLNIDLSGFSPGVSYPLAGKNIILTLVENPGIGFGLNPGMDFKVSLTLCTLIITAGLVVYLYFSRNDAILKKTALALLIGGALGNLVDRIFYGVLHGYGTYFHGRVVDFINIRMPGIFTPGSLVGNYVFNVADIAVSAGLVLMLFTFQVSHGENKNLAAENQE